jgi:hypothetical protein
MTSESALDGNALGGPLGELFSFEVTTAVATCAGCGGQLPIATWVVFMNAPGIVARCSICGRVQLRIVRAEPGRTWVDLSGLEIIEIGNVTPA